MKKEISFGKYKRISDLKGAKIWFKVDTKQWIVQQGMKTVVETNIVVEHEGFIYKKDTVWDTKHDTEYGDIYEVRNVYVRIPTEKFCLDGYLDLRGVILEGGFKCKPINRILLINALPDPFEEYFD